MQKPAMFAQELKFIFLPQLIATYISYLHGQTQLVCFSEGWIYRSVKEEFSSENTLSAAAEEGCTSSTN